jgi:two-component system LytT family response regulator
LNRIRTIVVDDEPVGRRRLTSLLGREPDVQLVGECGDGGEAIAAISQLRPDLVFLDVQMPEVDGFQVLEALDIDPLPVVVFVTAHEQYALKAFNAHALDYLLKPFDDERLQATVQRARTHLAGQIAIAGAGDRVRALLDDRRQSRRYLERIVVRASGNIVFVRATEIDWVEAADNYVRLHVGTASYLLRETMTQIEEKLDPDLFVRIHRSTIVNVERITRMEPLFHGEHLVVLQQGARLRASRTYAGRLQAVLENRV